MRRKQLVMAEGNGDGPSASQENDKGRYRYINCAYNYINYYDKSY